MNFSSKVQKVWIVGEEQLLQSRQDELRERYLNKTDMPAAYR